MEVKRMYSLESQDPRKSDWMGTLEEFSLSGTEA